ncbi:MAG: polyprenyl diphosphate synthase [Gammaproteobacteria bacterium]|nr:polyprenyl diphosphate synthase [Gammaproteobacteria bacterium]MDH4252942.1 polyprenyl diphosphate synthase [Gammaproteobacteria bacterium]MDH5308372.1 polyprenyl diphosphate synthase [Gammaproteobacteria bacterium]
MSSDSIPRHVAVIMDGNGRWAEGRSKPRYAGHRAGIGPVRETVEHAAKRGIARLTLFAFSSENWGRPQDEVSRLMGLFHEALQREIDELHANHVRLRFIGDRSMLRSGLRQRIADAEALTAANDGLGLNIAVAYGGRWDIANAARRLAERVERGELKASAIDEAEFATALSLTGEPDVDLLIRTGGEHRISNFLLWNLAYAELYFTDCLWPDFSSREFDAALAFFGSRERRYGHTGKQLGVA